MISMRPMQYFFLVGLLLLAAPPANAMDFKDPGVVDPPVVLSNESDRALIVKWQTSLPGVIAAPVQQRVLPVGQRDDKIEHANFWLTEAESDGEVRGVTNMIEVWVYAEEAPDLLISNFVTYHSLYAADFAERDKDVVLEIVVSESAGIDVVLETAR